MEVKAWNDRIADGLRIEVFIPNLEKINADFSDFDMLVLKSPIKKCSDILQNAELMVRRIEEYLEQQECK